ncbi:MAG: hypothetical protein U5K43_04555 [Halofilum sp. (in: g-proteobacteria)]|nr:hypothetical protein [Halofilum sp. (in: g-proteobacteria)]
MKLRKFPDEALARIKELVGRGGREDRGGGSAVGKVYESFQAFRDNVQAWHEVSERAYLNARAGA